MLFKNPVIYFSFVGIGLLISINCGSLFGAGCYAVLLYLPFYIKQIEKAKKVEIDRQAAENDRIIAAINSK